MKRLILMSLLLLVFLHLLDIAETETMAKQYDSHIVNYASPSVHNLNTTEDFATIQEAINDPDTSDGHIIQVDAGTYFEHVTITKSISLVGEDRDTTIIDGNGSGTTIQVFAHNVSIVNFTVRYAGRIWGPPPGYGYPDACIIGHGVKHIRVENNTFNGAAVCVAFADYSSLVNITNNIVFNATYIGILGYSSNNLMIYHNLVFDYGYEGIHLDGGSNNCRIANNTVMNGLDGISLEKLATSGNLIEGNTLLNNNVSIGIYAGGVNVFRSNNMTGNQHDLVIFGYSLDSFLQDIDDSNIVDDKIVYYLTNLHDTVIEPSSYPNLGYLAIVNCTSTTIRDFNIVRSGDGVLLAYSTNCTLTNITLSENRGPLMCGGLTFYSSNNNTIVNNRISNNSYAVCLNHSNGNIFYHNSFKNDDRYVISNFYSPFHGNTSEFFSINIWDNGFEGNYWSDYAGVDENKDGIGDSAYVVTPSPSDEYDHYPLMGTFHSYKIDWVSPGHVYEVTLISNSTITDFDVDFWMGHPENRIVFFDVTGESGAGFCRICIPYELMSPPYIVVIDYGETPVLYLNDTLYDNGTHRWIYFTYPHSTHRVTIIPEFQHNLIIATFLATSLIATITANKRKKFRI